MTHPFMETVARRLLERDIATLRYQFPYMEKGGGRPDPPRIAHSTVRAAAAASAKFAGDLPLFAGGRSYGGRMTSQAQAIEPIAAIRISWVEPARSASPTPIITASRNVLPFGSRAPIGSSGGGAPTGCVGSHERASNVGLGWAGAGAVGSAGDAVAGELRRRPVRLVGIVGEDFPQSEFQFWKSRKIDSAGVQRIDGKTFRWSGEYAWDLNTRETRSVAKTKRSARASMSTCRRSGCPSCTR